MATFNVEMRQRVSGSFADIIYPKAHWGNIDGKPATFAPTAHTHNIDDINATGTPSATNFLRGDGAWATPEGGGSSGLTIIADTTLPSAAARLTLSNLSLQKGKMYNFVIEWKADVVRPFSIVINNIVDTTNSKYLLRYSNHTHTGGGGYTPSYASSWNNSFFFNMMSAVNNESSKMEGSIYLTEEGYVIIRGVIHYIDVITNYIYTHEFTGYLLETVSSVTEISFRNLNEFYGDNYKAGTRFLLYEVI